MGVVVVRLSRTHAALIGLVLAATLGGCGGSGDDAGATAAETTEDASSDEPDDAASDEPAEETSEPAAPSVPRAPFCDAVTEDLVSSALGGPSQSMDAVEPGDVIEYPTGKEKIDSYRCRWQTNKESQDYGPDDATFAMAVLGKRATPAVVDERLTQSKDFLKQVGEQLGARSSRSPSGTRPRPGLHVRGRPLQRPEPPASRPSACSRTASSPATSSATARARPRRWRGSRRSASRPWPRSAPDRHQGPPKACSVLASRARHRVSRSSPRTPAMARTVSGTR